MLETLNFHDHSLLSASDVGEQINCMAFEILFLSQIQFTPATLRENVITYFVSDEAKKFLKLGPSTMRVTP